MSQENENQGRPLLTAGVQTEELGKAPADLGFTAVAEDDYDPEEARRLWLENRRQKELAAKGQAGVQVDDQSRDIGRSVHSSPSARSVSQREDNGSEFGRASGTQETTIAQQPVQPTVELQAPASAPARDDTHADAGAYTAQAQSLVSPTAQKEVIHVKEEAQTARLHDSQNGTGRVEHRHAEQQLAPAAPTFQPVADPAPQAETKQPAPPATHRVKSILEMPGHSGERSEFSELKEDDPSAMLAGASLIGGLRNLAESVGGFNQFIRGIPRDGNGALQFRSQEEQEIYERISQIMQIASPTMQNGNQAQSEAWAREDIKWQQQVDTGNGDPFVIKNHPRSGAGLMSAIYRRQNSGAPVTVFLPASGFFITSKAPHENDFCDYDVAQTMDTNQVGLSTFGILLSASSGLYLKHMFSFALKFVEGTTLDVGDGELHQTLYSKIDERDYWLVVMACTIAKYPSGIPWLLSCTSPTCSHEEELKLNIARCIRYANGVMTQGQQALINRQRDGELMTFTEQAEYRKQHMKDPTTKWVDDNLTFRFEHASIARYIDTTEEWVGDINKSTTEAMGNYATEQERNTYMRMAAENRRLTRYLHFIDSITSNEGTEDEYIEKDPIKIRQALVAMSSDRGFVNRFEAAIEKFNERSRLAIFGYMSHNCPACGVATGEKEGPFRGIVEISPDRLFFVLSRVVYEIQKLLTDQYESIG
ncbi:hypothetical protein PHOBOS_41 [Erwinia phage vB_EamM_Phobos]|uniref:hypothetical protein n=1 Tax=Erwinia phage vB_EamM_Phobos TaxID=1883377 RepID=UPI00081CDEC8|nr:hypothetical protein BIZ79_gp041 [Erwinia phage vB_EamM_Phobos]ANZ50231.1 hypothetical protein PHOBOS_41 [Erwinia phage vB_EamM_Phobos]